MAVRSRISVVRAVRAKPSGEGGWPGLTTASKQVAVEVGARGAVGTRACTLFMLILLSFKVPEATTGQPSRRWGSGFGPRVIGDGEQKGPLEAFWRWAWGLPALGCEPDGTQSPWPRGPQGKWGLLG